jgi:N-methylhydantoinase A
MQVAYGITQVANSAMTRVLKAVSTERGRDPRECAMVAFGGSGPVHAAALAEAMDITKIVIPIYPGLFSALGLLLADYRHDHISSVAARTKAVNNDEIERRWEQLRQTALARMQSDGIATGSVRFERFVDLKYGYQMEEMTLPFPDLGSSSEPVGDILTGVFTRAHQQAYGYVQNDEVELVSLRLRALAPAGSASLAETSARLARNRRRNEQGSREAFFGPAKGMMKVRVCGRFDIPETRQAGPIIVEEPDTTVVVPPGWSVARDALASLILTRA